jgi:branched-chain amino acid transport system ATP-binding protein
VLDQAQHALEAVGLADRADEIARALSHGEQRQLEIAICRATLPELLLLDEPLSGNGGGRIDEDDRAYPPIISRA